MRAEEFKIRYENKDSKANGEIFLVRESENHPHHYLISDGESHVGGGTLAKKYCVRILRAEEFYDENEGRLDGTIAWMEAYAKQENEEKEEFYKSLIDINVEIGTERDTLQKQNEELKEDYMALCELIISTNGYMPKSVEDKFVTLKLNKH